MRNRLGTIAMTLAISLFVLTAGVCQAQQPGAEKDVFKGKLFPPGMILEHRDALELSRDQYTAIRQAVVVTQSSIAAYEWDLREAYQSLLAALDASPVAEEPVLELLAVALAAENEIKKMQVALLIELRNLLTQEQLATLRQMSGYE